MPLRPKMTLREYGSLFLRRKWEIGFLFAFILLAASLYYVKTPRLYKSSITILVIPQTVPEDYVRSTVSYKAEKQLATLQQQVLSRLTLTKLMDELRLFEKVRMKSTTEQVIRHVRDRIEIEVVRGHARGSGDAFILSFLHEDPRLARDAAAKLASLFIDENLKTREQQAVGTSEFLESQLRSARERLEVLDQKVKVFKTRNIGSLPEQLESHLRILPSLQDRQRVNATNMRVAEERKAYLEAQIAMVGRSTVTAVAGESGKAALAADPVQALANELVLAKEKLAELSSRYTDAVPEVVRARREVEELEKRFARVQQSASSPDIRGPAPDQSAQALASVPAFEEIRRMRAQLKAATSEVASLKRERDEIRSEIAAIERRVAQSPRVEQEIAALVRDYEIQKKSYDDLQRKKLDADVSRNLEKRQKGSEYQILDPANLPEEPNRPIVWNVIGTALMLAMVLGFGGVIAWETFDPRLRSVHDFRHFYKVPIVGYIPAYVDPKVRRDRDGRRIAVCGGLIAASVVLSLILLVFRDPIRTVLMGFRDWIRSIPIF